LSEGVAARCHAQDATIFILNGFPKNAADIYEMHQLTVVLGAVDEIIEFENARKAGKTCFHLRFTLIPAWRG